MKHVHTSLFLMGTLTVSGCNTIPGDHYKVIIDPTFSSQEQDAIIQGLSNWEVKVPVSFDISIASCGGVYNSTICIHRFTLYGATLPSGYNAATDILGLTLVSVDPIGNRGMTSGLFGLDGGDTYLYMDAIQQYESSPASESALTQVTTHEVGHAMGLKHHNIHALMNINFNQASNVLVCDDVQQWYYVRNQYTVCK